RQPDSRNPAGRCGGNDETEERDMQSRMKEALTLDDALMLLEVTEAEVETLRQQLAEAHATIERQNTELDAIGAGGVSSQRITGTDARWYAVGADGQAT